MDNTSELTPLISGSGGSEPQPAAPINATLARYQLAVGINTTPSSHIDLEAARRSATGIYKEVISTQKLRERQYLFVEVVYYLAILANIVIGATLASLGQLSTVYPTTSMVLGIMNSSAAGLLALLKGQGLPDRLRKDKFEMRKVQDFIEEMETKLAVGVMGDISEKELDDIVMEVFTRYDVARDTAEMNRPERYVHQVDDTPADSRPGEQGASGGGGAAGQGVVQAGGAWQSKLALSSGKGKALVMS